MVQITGSDALVVVDVQNDFMPGGALGVPDGDRIYPALNPLTCRFRLVVATQDWHPPNHVSFVEQGGPWPPHCVQMTPGADFHEGLDQAVVTVVVRKGHDPNTEQYSTFDKTGLGDMLKSRDFRRVFLAGLATEYCVHDSGIDAMKEGLEVVVLTDCIAGIDVNPGDSEKALGELADKGATVIDSAGLD